MVKPPWSDPQSRAGDNNRKHCFRKLAAIYDAVYGPDDRLRPSHARVRALLRANGVNLLVWHRFRVRYRMWRRLGTIRPKAIDLGAAIRPLKENHE